MYFQTSYIASKKKSMTSDGKKNYGSIKAQVQVISYNKLYSLFLS